MKRKSGLRAPRRFRLGIAAGYSVPQFYLQPYHTTITVLKDREVLAALQHSTRSPGLNRLAVYIEPVSPVSRAPSSTLTNAAYCAEDATEGGGGGISASGVDATVILTAFVRLRLSGSTSQPCLHRYETCSVSPRQSGRPVNMGAFLTCQYFANMRKMRQFGGAIHCR